MGHNFVMQNQEKKLRWEYSDIVHCERPQFRHARRMSVRDRAAQFSPFSALRGFDEQIEESSRRTQKRPELSQEECDKLNARLRFLEEQIASCPTVQITRFVPDTKKCGGALVTEEVCIKRVNRTMRTLVLQDRTERSLDDIVALCGKFFEGIPGGDLS